MKRPKPFETAYRHGSTQPRLFELASLGESGWLKALKLDGHAPRTPTGPRALRSVLFPFLAGTGG